MQVHVVYLDQNAASFLAKPNPEPIWKEIRDALADGFRDDKLVCPLPFEGVMETAPRPLELRQAIQSFFWALSGGVAFKAFTEMSNELTLALVRPKPEWTPWAIWKPEWAERETAAKKVSTDWKSAKVRMMNRMNTFVPSPNAAQMTERALFHGIAEQRSLWVYKDLDSLVDNRIEEKSLNCLGLIQFLISEKLSPAEIEALKRAVLHHGWAEIPIHAFEILLAARWEFDSNNGGGAAYNPNDEIDRKRAAIALNHSDLFITEGAMADLCRRAKIDEFCPTLVLSVRNPIKVLDAVRSIIDRESLMQTPAAPAGLG
jgi:hypothetical protein